MGCGNTKTKRSDILTKAWEKHKEVELEYDKAWEKPKPLPLPSQTIQIRQLQWKIRERASTPQQPVNELITSRLNGTPIYSDKS